MIIKPAMPGDLARIAAAAAADNHVAPAPTHFIENAGGEVRGSFSAGGCELIFFWSHTGNLAGESIRMAKECLRTARASGKPVFCPCAENSPFVPLMPSMGFELEGYAGFWKLKA